MIAVLSQESSPQIEFIISMASGGKPQPQDPDTEPNNLLHSRGLENTILKLVTNLPIDTTYTCRTVHRQNSKIATKGTCRQQCGE
jgi:hypothetical protein